MITIKDNNLSPLPFYTDIDLQAHRRSYAYGQIYPLYTPSSFLLPFQIMREHRASTPITLAKLYTKDGDYVMDLLSDMTIAGLKVVEFPDFSRDVIVFPAQFSIASVIELGMYYLVLSDGTETWYSDIMTIVNDMTPYLEVEWHDKSTLYCDAGIIVYDGIYKNRLFFNSELGKPDYAFEEEGESRDGYFFAEKQISEKTYKFQFLAPEFVVDVMRLIRLSDVTRIRDKYNREFICDTFLITPTWQTQGDLASVVAEFQTATVVKKIAKGYAFGNGGDYNDDYNDDYNNQ